VDNAVDFHSMGGLETISAYISHPTRSLALRAQAAVVMGSSAQNNPKATENALSVGGLTTLLSLWKACLHAPQLKRVLFAVGSVVQNSDAAYTEFAALGGVPMLAAVLAADQAALGWEGCTAATKTKAAGLAADLILSQIMILHTAAHGPEYASPVLEGVDTVLWLEFASHTALAQQLAEVGWCDSAATALVRGVGGRSLQESVLRTVLGVAPHCTGVFSSPATAVFKTVARLKAEWDDEHAEEADDTSLSYVTLIDAVAKVVGQGVVGEDAGSDRVEL
jgi:hypothetical protein